jgi:hypothetical protein
MLASFLALPVTAEDTQDEFTREVARYELTLANLEAYGAMMAGLADWAEAKPAEAAAMRERLPKGPTTYQQSIAQVGDEPAIAEQLKQHKLTLRDFVLLPMVVLQARIAALGEAQGRTFPADRINPKNPALVRAHETRVNEIMTTVAADRIRVFGR